MSGREAELVDEVAEIGIVEVHVLVNVGQIQRWPAGGRRGWWLGAAEYVSKGQEKVVEQPTT